MDFWNRLIGGTGSSSALQRRKEQQPHHPVTPDQRLQKFKRIWQQILHTWRNARENDEASQDFFQENIKRLNEMLLEEEKRSDRHCMGFAYQQQVYIALSKIGQIARLDVVKETITTFSTLVDTQDENFLGQESFALSLMNFMGKTSQRLDSAFSNEFVKLLFNITAKIRQAPAILPIWFTGLGGGDRGDGREQYESLGKHQKFQGVTNKDDFPLFYLLIDFVYSEGRVGDFARTGLLYIIEAASPGSELERWMIESDLATLMASGLGALYSQLSRKLVITYSEKEQPTILTLSDYTNPANELAYAAEASTSPEFQTHLDTFLSYLIFWQDVLNHCKSVEVKQTLLDHFRILFLQQLLYPSLLESSDIDGGSAVAVLTYIRVILDTLEHPEIIHLILSYLMALHEKPSTPSTTPPTPSVARRRRSLDLLTIAAKADSKPSPDLFSLADLILTSLKSKSQQTVAATLRLISIILRKHHSYSISTLLKVRRIDEGAPQRTIGAHTKEMKLLFSMIKRIGAENVCGADSYEAYLKDNLELLECHPCSAKALEIKNPQENQRSESRAQDLYTHTLRLDDPLLKSVVELLSTFFSNSVETNLILTCVIVDLASCCYMKPEGWFLYDPVHYEYDEDSDEEFEEEWEELIAEGELGDGLLEELERKQMKGLKRARKEPKWKDTPPVMEVLQSLTKQIEAYRREIPDLDDKLHERKNAFRLTEHLNEAMSGQGAPPQPSRSTSSQNVFDTLISAVAPNSSVRGRPLQAQLDGSGYSTPNRPPSNRIPARRMFSPDGDRVGARPRSGTARDSVPFGTHVADTSMRKVRSLHPAQFMPPPPDEEGASDTGGSVRSATPVDRPASGEVSAAGSVRVEAREREFSLSHLLTNVLILQEFIMELAALTQVRASLFEDIKFV
ncbi:Retinoic acid induced 16-like protein-domain-containing protein [Terfezia claveryi]|nr:Retinoic acid induced 16-like protein-domain-containing protein [Terfezia claveryi]